MQYMSCVYHQHLSSLFTKKKSFTFDLGVHIKYVLVFLGLNCKNSKDEESVEFVIIRYGCN